MVSKWHLASLVATKGGHFFWVDPAVGVFQNLNCNQPARFTCSISTTMVLKMRFNF